MKSIYPNFVLLVTIVFTSFTIPPPAIGGEPPLLPTTFTVRGSESPSDSRYDYDLAAIELALEKTRPEHGPYVLISSPTMSFSRAIHIARKNQLTNFIIKLSYNPSEDQRLLFADFPVDLGITGYRVCFTNSGAMRKLARNRSMETLKQLTFGVGTGWAESRIFRHNKLPVREVQRYDDMFTMLNNGQYDLLCRGVNEILDEWQTHRKLSNFKLDRSIGFYYPLPRFFYSHKANTAAIARIEQGLKRAYNDGSLHKIWRKHYEKSIKFSNLNSRKIIKLRNPDITNLPKNYEKYLFDPL